MPRSAFPRWVHHSSSPFALSRWSLNQKTVSDGIQLSVSPKILVTSLPRASDTREACVLTYVDLHIRTLRWCSKGQPNAQLAVGLLAVFLGFVPNRMTLMLLFEPEASMLVLQSATYAEAKKKPGLCPGRWWGTSSVSHAPAISD